MMMDGPSNSVYEVNTEADPPGPANASEPYIGRFPPSFELKAKRSA